MARNLYMLAGTLGFFALACIGLSFSNIAQQPGSPGDAALWRTMGIGFLVLALLATLAGIFSHLFEQAERRAEEARLARRRKRAGYED
jgi:peptidoglycan/LPS O-acetylase OafA/YrhL